MAKSNKKTQSMPIRSSSHIQEDDSREIFQMAVKPWMIFSWIPKDYGIDAIVEITKQIARSKDQIVTGKRFSVQLKSFSSKDNTTSSHTISVPKEKINYWFNTIEPVLIVLIDVATGTCYYRWVDEGLISELYRQNENWIANETTSIKFSSPKIIDDKQLLLIEEYVIHWKRPSRLILTPGNYFKYSSEALSLIDSLLDKINQYHIPFLKGEIEDIKKQCSESTYTIAVAGPSRAGKSTLINSLLHRDVSPVGTLPTTGVPINIFPNNQNKAFVVFKNGETIEGAVDSSFLKEYTSQDKNPNNEKEVKLVSVNVVNTLLEKGFALCDVPGLDDPDDEIRAVTKTALFNVNAIVYVINTGSMRDGGFSFTKQIVDDLKELGARMDRLFVVLNKVDLLDESQKEELRKYVDANLNRHNILKYLPTPPIYLSARNSFEKRVENTDLDDSVELLENNIWEYLLGHSKSGLHKVLGTYADIQSIIEKLKLITKTQVLNSEKRSLLEQEISQVSGEINDLKSFVAQRVEHIYNTQNSFILNSLQNIINYLRSDLESLQLNQPMHQDQVISSWLKENGYKVFASVNSNLETEVSQLQIDINQWIAEKLNQVEISISDGELANAVRLPDIDAYTNRINYTFQGIQKSHPGILETILLGLERIVDFVIETVGHALTSDEKIRQREIEGIMKKAANCYNDVISSFLNNLRLYLIEIAKIMERKSIDRTNVYLGDLSNQLSKIDTKITAREKANFNSFLSVLNELEIVSRRNYLYLKEYTDGIGINK